MLRQALRPRCLSSGIVAIKARLSSETWLVAMSRKVSPCILTRFFIAAFGSPTPARLSSFKLVMPARSVAQAAVKVRHEPRLSDSRVEDLEIPATAWSVRAMHCSRLSRQSFFKSATKSKLSPVMP